MKLSSLVKFLLDTRDEEDYVHCASGNVTRGNGRMRFSRENVRNRPSSSPQPEQTKLP